MEMLGWMVMCFIGIGIVIALNKLEDHRKGM